MTDHPQDHGDRHADGGPDPIPGLAVGDTLWELDTGSLEPVASPTHFTVGAVDSMFFGTGGDWRVNCGDDITITAASDVTVAASAGRVVLTAADDLIESAVDQMLITAGTFLSQDVTSGNWQVTVGGASNRILLQTTGASNIELQSGRDVKITLGTNRFLEIVGLPTSNPGGTGRVWNDAGTLKIT